MADDTQNLSVTISAQDAGATGVLIDVRSKIAAIEQELATLGPAAQTAGTQVAAGAEKASVGLGTVAKSSVAAGEGLRALEGQTGTIARGLEAMGIQAGESAARVEAMIGALDGMSAAVPGLVAVGAALTVLWRTFDFFHEGVADAAEFQSQMSSLGAAVENQGGNWAQLSSQVRAFIAAESEASGIAQTQLITALNQLVTSNISVADSEKILGVAEEVAVAKHRDVIEVTHEIIEAEAGRGIALAQLDPRIKTMIQDHVHLSEVLRVLHGDNKNQLDDTQSLEVTQARLGAAYQALGMEVGSHLLPILTQLSAIMIGAIPGIEDLAKALADGLGGAFGIVGHGAAAAYHGILAVATAAVGDLKDAKDEGAASLAQLGEMGKSFGHATIGWMGDIGHAAGDMAGAYSHAENEITASIKKHVDALRDLNLQQDPRLGLLPKGKGAGGGFEPSDVLIPPEATRESSGALDAYHNSLSAVQAATLALKQIVDTSSTSDSLKAAHLEQLASAADHARAQVESLIPQVAAERDSVASSVSAVNAKYAAYKSATEALNELETKLKDHTKLSRDERDALDAAKNKQHEAAAEYHNANSALTELTSSLNKHTEQLKKDTAEITANTTAEDEAWKSYNDAVDKANLGYQAAVATYHKSLEQQIAYWQQRLAIDQQGGTAELQQAGEDYAHLIEVQTQFYEKSVDAAEEAQKKIIEAQKQADQQQIQEYGKLVDDLVAGGNTLKDRLKKVWNDILQDFTHMIEQMIMKSINFGNAGGGATPSFGGLTSIFAGPGAIPSTSTANGALYSAVDASNPAATSTWTQNMSADTYLNPLYVAAAPGSNVAAGGGSLNPADAAALINPAGFAAAQNVEYATPPVAGSSGASGIPSLPSGGNSLLASLFQGLAIGGAAASITGGNTTWGSIGGLLGGGLGMLLHANPLVGMGIDVLTGLLGGLFGDHWTPAQQPDISEPTYGTPWTYSQFVANMTGAPGSFNGQTIIPQGQYWGSNNMGSQLAYDLSHLPIGSNTNSALTDISKQLQSLMGNSPTGLDIASESQGMFTLDSGAKISVQAYMDLVNEFLGAYGAAGGQGAVPSFTISRTYPNLNLSKMHQTYPPSSSSGTGTSGTGSTGAIATAPTIHVDFSGATIVGPGGMDSVIQQIEQALQRAQAGQIPGAYANTYTSNFRRTWPQ